MKLRPYQKEDVQELLNHNSHGIFNEQRTGKTPTSLVAMAMKVQGRILIIATASMTYKWQEEARTWTGRSAHVYGGTKNHRKYILDQFIGNPSGILVISYGLVKSTKAYFASTILVVDLSSNMNKLFSLFEFMAVFASL